MATIVTDAWEFDIPADVQDSDRSTLDILQHGSRDFTPARPQDGWIRSASSPRRLG